jgi:hypothetical protein
MSSWIVCDGDELIFEPMFGPRQVVLTVPAAIAGTGVATIGRRRMCVVGDEARMQWVAQYFMPGYSPGQGIVRIVMLDTSQIAKAVTGRGPVVLEGLNFTADIRPTVPAILNSPAATPDTMAPSAGRGKFIPHQMFVRA